MAHLEKAIIEQSHNWPQTLHHANLSATKLKQLKDRPVELIDMALGMKYNALAFTCRHKEALECAKERYCLYLTNHTHPPAIKASFLLIESCLFNKEYYDAALYARTTWETITLSRDSHIPDNLRDVFTARGAMELARSLLALAQNGVMPAEEKQGTGVEAIMLARRALEINTQLHGAESKEVADNAGLVANLLDYFNDFDDDEVPRLYKQANAINAQVYGALSYNVAAGEKNLGLMYYGRAARANAAHDLDREVAMLELALPHFRDAARIFLVANDAENAGIAARGAVNIEEQLRLAKAFQSAEG